MSTKAKPFKKCAKFESQLFRRNLCKNCFKSELEHREDYVPPKPPDEKPTDPEPPVEKTTAKTEAGRGKKYGGKTTVGDCKAEENKKGSIFGKKFGKAQKKDAVDTNGAENKDIKEQSGSKAAIATTSGSKVTKSPTSGSKVTESQTSGEKASEKPGSESGQVKSPESAAKNGSDKNKNINNTSKTPNSDLVSIAEPSSSLPGAPGQEHRPAQSATHKTVDSTVRLSTGSVSSGSTQLEARHTQTAQSHGTGEQSKTIQQSGGGLTDHGVSSGSTGKNVTHSTGSSQISGEQLRQVGTAATGKQHTQTVPLDKQARPQHTETGSGGELHVSAPAVTPSKQTDVPPSVLPSISTSLSDTNSSSTVSIGSGTPGRPLEAPKCTSNQHQDNALSAPDSGGLKDAAYTQGVHNLEDTNQQITEGSVQSQSVERQQQLFNTQPTVDGALSPSQQQHTKNSTSDSSIQVHSAGRSDSVVTASTLVGQGQGIQAGGGDSGYQPAIQQCSGSDSPQIIAVEHCDQSGSASSLGTGSSPGGVSQVSGKGRTRRSRGNSDHLVQEPGSVAIQYPGSEDSTCKQAALIIIPSENQANRSVTSTLEPYLQETQHVAYHQPVSPENSQSTYTNVTSQQEPTKTLSNDTLRAISGSSLYYYPESDQGQQKGQIIYNSSTNYNSGGVGGGSGGGGGSGSGGGGGSGGGDWYYNSNVVPTRSQTDDDVNVNNVANKGTYFVRRRRKRPSVDESAWQATRQRRMADTSDMNLVRDQAMMEGTRMLIDSLREKVVILEARTEKIDREKNALGDLLSNKKEEYINMEEDMKFRIEELEDQVNRLSNEKIRLLDRMKLPESERSSLRVQETEINDLQKKLEEHSMYFADVEDENEQLKQECRDLQLEMEEMHDQFREDEALEFREIQKELEATAKNCRILQFKMRKAERRNEQIEADRIHYEEKIRQLEARFESIDDKQHIREMEEELKMAKEVSVRLHDELEMVEEKRQRYEEELDRMNDILTESENRRHSLQKEVDTLTIEMAKLQDDMRRNNIGGTRSTKKGAKESEYDLANLMRDLSDSLERENDLKEQMKFAEEETRLMRKKLSDLEEENESLNLQLQKISSAKSGKFLKKDPGEKEIVTEREHDMRLEMELAEQEIKVLRRKLDDLEEDNELLMKQIKDIQNLIEGKVKKDRDDEDDDRPYDEKIRDLAKDIESLKMKLISKDQDAADLLRRSCARGMLKKSRSLEEYREQSPSMSPVREFQQDIKRQLDFVQQEASVLKEKLAHLEQENERLTMENRKLELMSGRTAMPSITADDAVIQNIDLKDRVKLLEEENFKLRHQIKLLDERTSKLSKDVLQTKSRGDILDDTSEARDVRNQLHVLETECRGMRKKITDLETQNSKLTRDLTKYKPDAKKSKDWRKLDKCSSDELKDRVRESEAEVKDLLIVIKNRAEETERIEEEIDSYREDIDKMLDAFKTREKELIEEIENVHQRNEVLTNLLDLVTERADSTAKQLEKYQDELFSQRSGSTAISAASDVSTGSDDVFVASQKDLASEKKVLDQNWEAKFKARIETLEVLLQEERLKVQAAEKKLSIKDSPMTSVTDDIKLKEREKEILQQELVLCQKQLKSANEQVKSLKERLSKEQESYESAKEDYEKISKQLEAEKKKGDLAADTKKPASWRWEKQELEKQIKEQKKKLDDMHEELKRQQFKWKMAGDDLARENKLKEKLEKQLQDIRDECEAVRKELEDTKAKLEELLKNMEKKEKKWTKDKESLESDKKAAERDAKDSADVIKSKDAIIKNKDKLVEEKDKSLKEREELMTKNEELVKQKDAEIKMKDTSIKHKEDEFKEAKQKCQALENAMKDRDERLKKLDEDIRRRDDRLKEKDEILEKINRKLVDKQNEVSDMDKTIRQAMNKLDEREGELKKMKSSAENANKEMKSLEGKVKDLRAELEKQKKEYEKKISTTTKQKEKSDSELNTIQKEKKALLNDLQDAKEKLKREQEKWKKEKNKLELDLNQKTEKLRSLDANRGLRQSEVVKNLSTEKEQLITEKHKLSDDVNKVKKELKDSTKQWNSERDELQKIIQDKTKLIEDNQTITERMQKDIESLKKTQASPNSGQKSVPIPVMHEVSSHRIPVIHQTADQKKTEIELKAKIEEQDILMEADKEGFRDLYEGRLANLTEELGVAHDKITSLKDENDKQLELLQSSRKALADLRNRYDTGLNTWSEERDHLQKKAKEAEQHRKRIEELQKNVDEIQDKLKTEVGKAKEVEKRLNTEKKVWAVEKTNLQSKLKQAEESGSTGGSGRGEPKVSEFRAKFDKFEKFGGVKPGLRKTAAPSGGGSVDVKTTDVDRTVKEAQKAIKELQTLTKETEKSRELDKKELMTKLEKEKKLWEKEKKELKERTTKLEARSKEMGEQEKNVVELQCKLQDERATWLTEKNQLQETLDLTKDMQLKEKSKVTELLAEVRRLKTLTEAIHSKDTEAASEVKFKGTRRSSRTPSEEKEKPTFTKVKIIGSEDPDEVKKALDKSLCEIITKALEHISRLAEELQNPVRLNEGRKKSTAQSVFRRSLSTSEVDTPLGKESFMYSPQSEVLITPSYPASLASALPPPTIYTSSLERQSRSRHSNRGLSTDGGEQESSVIDRRSFRSSSNRNSMYASGTQSAYTSRDSSPEKGKKRSPYPVAPPSMIITPSHTPRRAPSAERERRSFSSRDMARLYAKLSSIETGQEQKEESKALVKERGKGFRILTKSTSVDHADEASKKMNLRSQTNYGPDSDSTPREGYHDADASETPMASIRLGQLVITPGVEKYTKAYREQKEREKRSVSVSPRSARKKFYDNYPYESKESSRWVGGLGSRESDLDFSGTEADSGAQGKDDKSETRKRRSLSRGKSLDTEMDADLESATDNEGDSGRSRRDKYSLRSKAANFIQSVKDKRKLFSKRSSSVDTSVRNSIAHTGFQAATAGAPSSFEPPKNQDTRDSNKDVKKDSKETKRKAFHRRSTSIDMTSLFTATRSSSAKDRDKVIGSSSSSSTTTGQSHSSSASALARDERSSGQSGTRSHRSTPSLSVLRPGKKSLFDGKKSKRTVKHSSCQTIPSLGDRDDLHLQSHADLILRSTSFRRATSECPLVVTQESITPFNIWNFNETPV